MMLRLYLLCDRDTSVLLIELFIAYTSSHIESSNGALKVILLNSAIKLLFKPE